MTSRLIGNVPRIEGQLRIFETEDLDGLGRLYLQSGQSTQLCRHLVGRYPLEAVQLSQTLSERSSVAHGIASVTALEDYLHIHPTTTALKIRQILLDLSTIRSHIYHFYWELLPDYLNNEHVEKIGREQLWYYSGFHFREKAVGDLETDVGIAILQNAPRAAQTLDLLQKALTILGGKYPVIMNQIPGGITNFTISRDVIMKVVRLLELCKECVEDLWPADVKLFIQDSPDTLNVIERNSNFISFGSINIEEARRTTSSYSEGVLVDGRLEPVNELNISESLNETYFLPLEKGRNDREADFDLNKPGARTWIKGARYEGQTMLTGSLSRMMVTHLAGGNLEISDKIGQMIDDLELTFESPNCLASRMLTEAIEGRILLKNVFKNLFESDSRSGTNRQTRFNFSPEGVGVGRIEGPSGSMFHQIYISNGRITQYRIITPMNWNFSPSDELGLSGVVEDELNTLKNAEGIQLLNILRIIHSYNAHVLDGTQ